MGSRVEQVPAVYGTFELDDVQALLDARLAVAPEWFPGAIVSPHSPREAYRTVKDNAWREESALCSPAQRYEH